MVKPSFPWWLCWLNADGVRKKWNGGQAAALIVHHVLADILVRSPSREGIVLIQDNSTLIPPAGLRTYKRAASSLAVSYSTPLPSLSHRNQCVRHCAEAQWLRFSFLITAAGQSWNRTRFPLSVGMGYTPTNRCVYFSRQQQRKSRRDAQR